MFYLFFILFILHTVDLLKIKKSWILLVFSLKLKIFIFIDLSVSLYIFLMLFAFGLFEGFWPWSILLDQFSRRITSKVYKISHCSFRPPHCCQIPNYHQYSKNTNSNHKYCQSFKRKLPLLPNIHIFINSVNTNIIRFEFWFLLLCSIYLLQKRWLALCSCFKYNVMQTD